MYGMNSGGGKEKFDFAESFRLCTTICKTVGITKNSLVNDLIVFPNPASNGIFKVSGLNEEIEIVVFNMLGQEVLKSRCDKSNDVINLSDQPPGTYLFKINNCIDWQILKVIKE